MKELLVLAIIFIATTAWAVIHSDWFDRMLWGDFLFRFKGEVVDNMGKVHNFVDKVSTLSYFESSATIF